MRQHTAVIALFLLGGVFLLVVLAGGRATYGQPGVLFQDDFNDGNADGWYVLEGDWRVVNYEYMDDRVGAGYRMDVTTVGSPTWADYVYEAQVLLEQREGGLAFRVSDDSRSGYMTTIRPHLQDALLMKAWDFPSMSHVYLDQVAFSASYNTWYTMKVVVEGSDMTVYVDDQPILSATDAEFAAGKIGLYQVKSIARYDNVLVTALESPAPPAVGGIAELPDVADSAGRNYVALAGLAAAGVVALTAGTWYARRQWSR